MHTNAFARTRLLFFTVCALCVLSGKPLAQNFRTIHECVEYAQVDHRLGDDPVKVNLLRLDLTKVRLDVHHALDRAIGLETTSSIAKRKGAVAAINAGFFRLDKSEFAGDAASVLIIDRKLLSESYDGRIAIGMINGRKTTEVFFGNNVLKPMITGVKHSVIGVDGINRELKTDEKIVYTPEFGPSTLSAAGTTELVVRKGRIVEISLKGNSPIPKDGFVISTDEEFDRKLPLRSAVRLSTSATIPMYGFAPHLENEKIRKEKSLMFRREIISKLEDVTNGVPQLIKGGKIGITWEQERASRSFAETRHPRTAVAKLKDGKFLMMTADGRQPGVSVGMTLQELAEYLLSLGAVDAMNLDGGGSTTMYLNGKVVNTPSDKEGERKIGDAILVTLRKKPLHR
jgi:hypothetical protein